MQSRVPLGEKLEIDKKFNQLWGHQTCRQTSARTISLVLGESWCRIADDESDDLDHGSGRSRTSAGPLSLSKVVTGGITGNVVTPPWPDLE